MTVYTIYADAVDGYGYANSPTYATARAMGAGTVVNTSYGATYTGQVSSFGYTCYQSFQSWDTSSVVGTVTAATVSLYGQSDVSAVDFTIQVRLHDWGASLTTADLVAGADLSGKTLLATFATSGWSTGGYNDFTDVALPANINQAGSTRVIIVSSRQVDDTAPPGSEYVGFYSADTSGTSQDPKLVVTTSSTATGTIAATLPKLQASTSGAQTQTGTGTPTTPRLAAAATGAMLPAGTASPSLPALQAAATGTQTQTATATPTLPAFRAAATGAMIPAGTAAGTLPSFGAAAAGAMLPSGTAAATLPSIGNAASGTTGLLGTGAPRIAALVASGLGVMLPAGTAAGTLPSFAGSASGTQAQTATGAVTLPSFAAAASGAVVIAPIPGYARAELLALYDARAELLAPAAAATLALVATATATLRAPRVAAQLDQVARATAALRRV